MYLTDILKNAFSDFILLIGCFFFAKGNHFSKNKPCILKCGAGMSLLIGLFKLL
jgi:hypothetical protein